MSSPPRRSSPRRPTKDDVGKRTGITLPPVGAIPLNEEGYEDMDAFWDAAKSPHPDQHTASRASSTREKNRSESIQRQTKAQERQRKLASLQSADASIVQNSTLAHNNNSSGGSITNNNTQLKHKYGLSTPKHDESWNNRLLHHAMGITDSLSPAGTVLSKVSTAPRSVKTVQQQKQQQDDDEMDGPMDPPEEEAKEEERGVDPEENAFDNNDATSFDVDATSSLQQGGKSQSSQSQQSRDGSSGKTPDMEESMEEMVDRYEDEYDKEEGRGFELNTQEDDVGFDAGYDGFDDDEEEQEQVVSQKSAKSTTDDEVEEGAEAKKPRGRPKNNKQDPTITPTSVLRTKKSGKRKKNEVKSVNWSTPNGTTGYPIANRDYELHPVSEYKQYYEQGEEPKTPGGTELRRSKRFRVKPLQYWKNERFVYAAQNEPGALGEAMGDMPVVKDVQFALPTPHKERPKKETRKKEEEDGRKKKRRRMEDDSDDDMDGGPRARIPFDSTQLKKKYHYSNGERGTVWSEALEDTTEFKLVSRLDNRSFSKLPLSADRGKKESKVVGFASQAFHVPTDQDDLFPGYIAGNVVLPPRGIKDAEGVGLCSQVFNVGDCQPGSVEFALADPASQDGEFDPKTAQRYLLSKGDMFQIPPGNVYRIENHSKTDEARLFWTIIKCTSRAEQEQESDEE